MGEKKAQDDSAVADHPNRDSSLHWIVLATSLLTMILALATLPMHSWMSDFGTVEINTPELQGKQVDWELNYGLRESISHFGEEVEITEYECNNSDSECSGVKTAGLVAMTLIVIGALTCLISIIFTFVRSMKGKGNRAQNQTALIGGVLVLLAPLLWFIILPGVFPPIEGMYLGLAFYLALVAGLLGTAGGVFAMICEEPEVSA
jgi:hypothetical protein